MTTDKQQASQNIEKSSDKKRALIEEWLPIAEIGIESLRERTPMTPFPAPNRLHVWWARRPLVACRAAILGALLPDHADREKFMHALGIHGDPVAAKIEIEKARKSGERIKNPYSYPRSFSYTPSDNKLSWFREECAAKDNEASSVLDVTAGGGSIPFESVRLGCSTLANDLNPVAWMIIKASVEFPLKYGSEVLKRFDELSESFVKKIKKGVQSLFPESDIENREDTTYLWARTIKCPYCNGIVPLSPNWRLNNKGTGVKLTPLTEDPANRRIRFEIVSHAKEQSAGTVSRGNARCPFPDCGRVIEGTEVKSQAQAGKMGEQLYAIVYKEHTVTGYTKAGKEKIKKIRGFRAPRPEDDVRQQIAMALDEKMPEWVARGIVPDEERYIGPSDRSANYGILNMQELFSPRQLYGHCTSVEVFHELIEECGGLGNISEIDKAALTYIALALDKILNYNSVMSIWMPTREVVANTFNRHDFAFCWSYSEMAPTITGLGYDWAFKQTGKSLKELIALVGNEESPDKLFGNTDTPVKKGAVTISCESGDMLPHIEDRSVDAVVMDPPYYDNVMYAELSDFFYVWLKRTAGLLYPEQFAAYLTDKEREAVANTAKFKTFSQTQARGSAKKMATRDYQERMQAIFHECRRVLKPEGVMVLMFTHKASGAWDALAKGLVEAGFVITASWPINTEAEGSLHIKDKNAAKSTIFLVCRPRASDDTNTETIYWEDVEPKVRQVVNERVRTFQESGVRGVDLYLACFGPALEVFSENWPMQRGRAVQKPEPAKGAQFKLIEDQAWDPYSVSPEDALMAARTAVKQWRLAQLASVRRQADLDPVTEFFVMAWDAFQAPQFPADEALKLARVVGVSFDQQLRGRILEVKGANVTLWDSDTRAQKGALGTAAKDNMIDILHKTAQTVREQNSGVAKDMLERAGLLKDPVFMLALETVLNVLPPPQSAATAKPGALHGAAADCDALENLRRLAFAKDIPQPRQLRLGKEF
ncbi:DUF1156 domain-containing protein [Desulfococcaceae bacterium HSG9]|nr:DUF1156 domain-containing protein [Desulfococcaceae bacterium HSG9]